MNFTRIAPRASYAVGAVACALLLGFAAYLQYGKGVQPCPLCLVQRAFYYALMALFIVAAAHAPGRIGAIVYGALAVLLAAGGASVASRQVWLQHLPPDQVPQCGPDLFFMLENFPLGQALTKLFAGSGECAALDWSFLGLTTAGWSLAWFVMLALYALWLMRAGAARA